MGKYIGEFDKTEMIIQLLEVLEIKGSNPIIEKVQDECEKNLKDYLANVDTDWLILLMIRIRKDKEDRILWEQKNKS
jgi:hypothetical protein